MLLPVIVNLDGFTLSHVIEPIEYFDQAEVDSYLKPFVPAMRLDPKNPITMGPVGMPEVYTEARMAQEQAMKGARPVIAEAWQAFGDQFGRYYRAVETYQMEDAETVLITMGSIGETAMTAVDGMRSQGKKVGLVRIRLFRPFPIDELREALKGRKTGRRYRPGPPVWRQRRSGSGGGSIRPVLSGRSSVCVQLYRGPGRPGCDRRELRGNGFRSGNPGKGRNLQSTIRS